MTPELFSKYPCFLNFEGDQCMVLWNEIPRGGTLLVLSASDLLGMRTTLTLDGIADQMASQGWGVTMWVDSPERDRPDCQCLFLISPDPNLPVSRTPIRVKKWTPEVMDTLSPIPLYEESGNEPRKTIT